MPGRPKNSRKSKVSKTKRIGEWSKIRRDEQPKPEKQEIKAEDKPEESE